MTRQKINKIVAFKAADGKIFTDREEYLAYERQAAFGAKVADLIKDKVMVAGQGRVFVDEGTLNGTYVVTEAEVAQLIVDNADALRDILNGKSSVKRTRRTKKQIAADKAANDAAAQPVATAA